MKNCQMKLKARDKFDIHLKNSQWLKITSFNLDHRLVVISFALSCCVVFIVHVHFLKISKNSNNSNILNSQFRMIFLLHLIDISVPGV